MRDSILEKIENKLDELAETVIDGDMNYAEMWIIIQTNADEETLDGIYSAFNKELQTRTERP